MAYPAQFWELDDEETMVFWGLCICAVAWVMGWAKPLALLPKSPSGWRIRLLLAGAPLLGVALIYGGVHLWADPEQVAGHGSYELLFVVGGVLWMLAFASAAPLAGISARDDATERANPAAATAIAGAMLGIALTYGGANIGRGPTIWTTFGPAALGAGALLLLWMGLAFLGGSSEQIAVERDLAAGSRAAGFLSGAGAILGRALAGDFYGWRGVFRDFAALGWPALLLLVVGAVVDRLARPAVQRPRPSPGRLGVAPGALYLLGGLAWVLWQH